MGRHHSRCLRRNSYFLGELRPTTAHYRHPVAVSPGTIALDMCRYRSVPNMGGFARYRVICAAYSVPWKLIPTAVTSKNPPTPSATNTDTWFAVTSSWVDV
jgi:hypothetical protein